MLTLIAAGVMVGSGLFIAGYALGRRHAKPVVKVEQQEVMEMVNEGCVGDVALGLKLGDYKGTASTYLTQEELNHLMSAELSAEVWELSSSVQGIDVTIYQVTDDPEFAGKAVLNLFVRGENYHKYKWENLTSSKSTNVKVPVIANIKSPAITRLVEAALEAELRKY